MSDAKPRARDLGVPFDGEPGPLDAITDVAGVEVGHVTLISSDGDPCIRTGVTALHPLGRGATDAVLGGWFSLNGNGEMTGTAFLDEFGTVFGPIALTNTLSVGLARDSVAAWSRRNVGFGHAMIAASLPVAAETWDGQLNDIFGFHVTREHVFEALDSATGGPVAEGNVGGGTGMTSYEFKAGIGTASRRVRTDVGAYTLGVLVQANYGKRPQLTISGVPVGREIADLMPSGGGGRTVQSPSPTPPEASASRSEAPADAAPPMHAPPETGAHGEPPPGDGSIIAIVATDAPLLPIQLRAIAKRVSLGLGRLGSIAAHSSGDLFLAFSTGNRVAYGAGELHRLDAVPTTSLDPLYEATVQATEEAIVNALVAADTMTGIGGKTFHALPHDRLRDVLARYGRLLD